MPIHQLSEGLEALSGLLPAFSNIISNLHNPLASFLVPERVKLCLLSGPLPGSPPGTCFFLPLVHWSHSSLHFFITCLVTLQIHAGSHGLEHPGTSPNYSQLSVCDVYLPSRESGSWGRWQFSHDLHCVQYNLLDCSNFLSDQFSKLSIKQKLSLDVIWKVDRSSCFSKVIRNCRYLGNVSHPHWLMRIGRVKDFF